MPDSRINEVVTLLLGGVGGAVGAAIALWLGVQYLLKKRLDSYFSRLELILGKQLALSEKAAEVIQQKDLAIYPALSELVYRAKTAAEASANARNIFEIAGNDLKATCRELTSELYRYRVYLPKEAFDDLHEYKHLLQDLILIADVSTRPDLAGVDHDIPKETQEKVLKLSRRIARKCDELIPRLGERLKSLRGEVRVGI